ncbi:MAG: type IIA DNA topoisomerase subunit B [Treponema sp.]|uniref:DNA topoisomerase IV subunit B n=1 Tax=Treponema sp. TaxID=166 RepID=UPI00298E3829|nr:DNA topoisomerase IV subunit B [Treponema sp.]MBR5932643.1 type IIA DNA topoisomerase subunit B [Treponema sp.]
MGGKISKKAASKPAAKSKAKTAAKTSKTKTVSKAPVKKVEAPVKKTVAAKQPASRKAYDESQIKHLDALEHIRLRSGMYIGRLGDGSNQNDGIYVLLKEVIDNSIDEFIMGYGKKIDVSVKDNRVKVRDYGRGIPLGKVVECVSEINTGAKYNDDVFQFSVGMNGVGTKAVNALSSYFRVVSVRDGECFEAIFEKGKLLNSRKGKLKEKQPNGTFFEFVPDADIFGKYNYNLEFVEKRMWNYAYLNEGLTIKFNGQDYHSNNGLFDLLNKEIEDTSLYPIGSYVGEHLRFAFTHTNGYGENHFSFVNGQYTTDGGTHLNAFKEGFVKGINDFYGTNYKAEDVREGMAAAVLVKVKDPVFESQTKNKLGNTDVRAWIVPEVQSGLNDWLHKNPEAAKKIEEKIKANEKLRTELSAVKKEAKEAAKKISIRIPKLKDCKYHVQDGNKGADSMIFITEGDSATGTMTHSRDASFQAIFSLRGKPENMYGKKQSEIYKNDELYQLMMALGIETDVENLKYERIIIATDADNDGYHIRNLVMTFFLGYFEELVTSGRVFILETPLFRVRNKKENIYCYSEEERDKAQAKLGKGAETTRFKGLGEINPSEFRQFINPETMHLTPVEISQLKTVPQLLNFYMGKNTPERRAFIEKHLLSNADIDA